MCSMRLSSSSRSLCRCVNVRKSKLYGSRRSCFAKSDSGSGKVAAKLLIARPSLRCRLDSMWCVSTTRDQLCWIVFGRKRVQSRGLSLFPGLPRYGPTVLAPQAVAQLRKQPVSQFLGYQTRTGTSDVCAEDF